MLQDEILKISDYFQSIEYYGDALIVKVKFPPEWKVYPSDNNSVKPAKSDDGYIFYYGDSTEGVTLEDIFALINDTISTNKSVALKIELLKNKIEELKELFTSTPLEELYNLKFIIEEKKKSKRSYNRKKKTENDNIENKENKNVV